MPESVSVRALAVGSSPTLQFFPTADVISRIFICSGISLALAFLSGCGSPGTSPTRTQAPIFQVRVVKSFPHDFNAFTQGLEIEGEKLYESTGREGFSSVRHVDLQTGEVTLKHDLPDACFGEGLTIMGDQIYQITYKNRICFVYEKDTLKKTKQFNYSGEGWGLANDGKHLFMTDKTSTISIRDPETFDVIRTLRVKDGRKSIVELNELEYFDGHIWANIWRQDKIAKIDPESGAVVAWLDCSRIFPAKNRDNPQEDVLNGIARDTDSGRLFITGKMWPKLYEIEILDK